MFYFLLATLTDDGLNRIMDDPDLFNRACDELDVPGTRVMARYGVLGRYDFVVMVDASEPEDVARLSVALGSKANVHIETLTAVGATFLSDTNDLDEAFAEFSNDEPGAAGTR